MTNTADLRAAAEAATPGPWTHGRTNWRHQRTDWWGIFGPPHISRLPMFTLPPKPVLYLEDEEIDQADARYVALASPDRILALCEENDELRSALKSANQIISMTRRHLSEDHPDCAYEGLGLMNDGRRAALEGKPAPSSMTGGVQSEKGRQPNG